MALFLCMQFSVCRLLLNLGCTVCSSACCLTATWNQTWCPWALWMVAYTPREMGLFEKPGTPLWKYLCLGPWGCTGTLTTYISWLSCKVIPAVFCSSFFSSELMKWTLWQVANISLTVQMVQQVNAFRLTDETEVLLSSSCPLVIKNIWVKNIWSKYMSYWKWEP